MECFAKIVKGCNYFRNISFSRFLLYEINIMNFLNTSLIFTPEVFILCKKVWWPRGLPAVDFDIPFTTTTFHYSKRTERPFRSLTIGKKKSYRIYLNFRKLLQFFLETFQQLLETSEVESFLSALADVPGSFPQNCFEQVFCKAYLRPSASVKKDLHSWRYLRNFSEFQKCARLESVVFGMQFTKKELHYRLQCRHLRKLFGVNIANCRFLEVFRRTSCCTMQKFLLLLYKKVISLEKLS